MLIEQKPKSKSTGTDFESSSTKRSATTKTLKNSSANKSHTKDHDDTDLTSHSKNKKHIKAASESRSAEKRHEKIDDTDGESKTKKKTKKKTHSDKKSTSKSDSKNESSLKSRILHFWTTKKFIFSLGALAGLLVTWYLTANHQIEGSNMSVFQDLIDNFKETLPRGVIKEVEDIESGHQDLSEPFRVGRELEKTEHLKPVHPVIMVPGVISTGLESWSLEGTPECPTDSYFRKRLWGSWNMLKAMLFDKSCWLQNLMLDDETGLDPPHFKIRAAQGLGSADFFVTGYWIWGRIMENLAVIGYDPGIMQVAAYDWRLAHQNLEIRDRYYSQLKIAIEDRLRSSGKKTVLISHSMGSQVLFYFLKWVEAKGKGFGNGGSSWVNDHIEAFVDISGSTLGTPKAIVALLSGEMKDTVQLNAMAVYGLEQFFSKRERVDLLRSFGGLASMLPKGGNTIWGDLNCAPDDYPNQNVSFGNFIRFKQSESPLSDHNLTVSESIDYLYSQTDQNFVRKTKNSYSYGLARSREEVEKNEKIPAKWTNPLEVALPNAPDMKIYCLYGVGKPTERSYWYKEEEDKNVTKLNVSIATGLSDPVMMGEGDGTVSLLTHTMCYEWKRQGSKFNPGNINVTVVEMEHEPTDFDIRGGAKTADHVDILGRAELNELVLRIAAGKGDTIEEHIFSPLKDWAAKMDSGSD